MDKGENKDNASALESENNEQTSEKVVEEQRNVSDGDEKEKLAELRDALGLQNDALFVYKIEEQLKVALLNECDLFLMPSVIYKKSVEGFGISFIEAAAYGTGSIGGIAGGASDAIQDGISGYLCNGESLNSIYDTIVKFFDNNNFKQLGKNAFTFSKNFHWEKVVKKYIKLI